MIIYRFCGTSEIWKGTGMLPIDPQIDSSAVKIAKAAKAWIKEAKRAGVQYKVHTEQLVLQSLDKDAAMQIFREDSPESLIQERTELEHWSTL